MGRKYSGYERGFHALSHCKSIYSNQLYTVFYIIPGHHSNSDQASLNLCVLEMVHAIFIFSVICVYGNCLSPARSICLTVLVQCPGGTSKTARTVNLIGRISECLKWGMHAFFFFFSFSNPVKQQTTANYE